VSIGWGAAGKQRPLWSWAERAAGNSPLGRDSPCAPAAPEKARPVNLRAPTRAPRPSPFPRLFTLYLPVSTRAPFHDRLSGQKTSSGAIQSAVPEQTADLRCRYARAAVETAESELPPRVGAVSRPKCGPLAAGGTRFSVPGAGRMKRACACATTTVRPEESRPENAGRSWSCTGEPVVAAPPRGKRLRCQGGPSR